MKIIKRVAKRLSFLDFGRKTFPVDGGTIIFYNYIENIKDCPKTAFYKFIIEFLYSLGVILVTRLNTRAK